MDLITAFILCKSHRLTFGYQNNSALESCNMDVCGNAGELT